MYMWLRAGSVVVHIYKLHLNSLSVSDWGEASGEPIYIVILISRPLGMFPQ